MVKKAQTKYLDEDLGVVLTLWRVTNKASARFAGESLASYQWVGLSLSPLADSFNESYDV